MNVKLSSLGCFVFAASCLFGEAVELDARPNVVILLTDDQGTLDANCYGSKDLLTPNMDRLAASGIRFTQAYAHTVCCPARAALLTGRHPQRGGVTEWMQGDRHGSDRSKANMDAAEVTLAEVFQAAGYRTALFGKWHLGAKPGHGPLDQGFGTFFGHLSGFIDNERHHFLHSRGFHDLWEGNEEIFRPGEYFPEMLAERAVDYIGAHQDKPFFMMVSFNLPHYPEQPGRRFKEAYADMPMPRQSYARVISTVDDHIGRILDKLEQTGQRERTIVIFMSDNGHSVETNAGIMVDDHSSGHPRGHYYLAHGGGGNTGKWIGHKGTYLEGGIRVPAMISHPGKIAQGGTRDQIVTIMDWFPTVLDLCGLKTKDLPPLDGLSLAGVLKNPEAAEVHEVLHFGWRDGWAVRRGDWKLIGGSPPKLHKLTGPEPEVKDHAAGQPGIVAELKALHEVWANEVKRK